MLSSMCLGIILTDGYSNNDINPINKLRATSYLNIAGQKIIDFSLNNMLNTNLESIGVVCCRNNYVKLRTHLSSNKKYKQPLNDKKIVPVPNFGSSDNNSLSNLLEYIQNSRSENVIICESNLVSNINFSKLLEFHESHESPITAVYSSKFTQLGINTKNIAFDIDHSGKISDVKIFSQTVNGKNVALNVYVVDKSILVRALEDCIENGLSDIIVRLLLKNLCGSEIQSYKHSGFAHCISNIDEYYKLNMKILEDSNLRKSNSTYKKLAPKNTGKINVKYGKHSNVLDSIVAPNCQIEGHVENSVVFGGVVVSQNSIIKNSIIMQDSHIGENCIIENAVLNPDVIVKKSRKHVGNNESPILVNQEVG